MIRQRNALFLIRGNKKDGIVIYYYIIKYNYYIYYYIIFISMYDMYVCIIIQ